MSIPKPYLRNRSNRTNFPASLAVAIACLGYLFPLLAPAANPAQNNTAILNEWTSLGLNRDIRAVAIDPTNPNIIYAGSESGLFKSTDGGASWSKKGLNKIQQLIVLVIDFLNPNTIYAGGYSPGTPPGKPGKHLFKSTDGGETWSNRNSPVDLNISLLVMYPTSPQTLYAGSARYVEGGINLHKSTDGGETWLLLPAGDLRLAAQGWVFSPPDPQTLYAPGNGRNNFGLYKSTDGGESWSGTGMSYYPVSRAAIDPLNPNTLYAAADEYVGFYSLFKSTDAGASWFTINNGLADLSDVFENVEEIIIDPDDPNILFVSFSNSGVFWSADGGASWSKFNTGLTNRYIRVLAIDGTGNRLYAATAAGLFVNQFPCVNPFSSISQSFDSSGGTGHVAFEASSACGWTAASSASWITITSGGSGSGDGTVSYSVAANESTDSRNGIIDIGVRPFTVSQAGLPVRITRAAASGKKLFVFGENFDEGAIIWLNGQAKITQNDPQNPKTSLIGKKAGKKIKPGDKLQVMNPNGSLSEEFTFTGP